MPVFKRVYNFSNPDGDEVSDWVFSNPDGTTGLGTGGRKWNWANKDAQLTSTGVSSHYTGVGYIFTKSTYPTKKNDVFSMELSSHIDASDENILFHFEYSANTYDNSVQLRVYAFNGIEWVKELDSDIKSSTSDFKEVLLDFTDYTNTNFNIKIEIDMNRKGIVWKKDVIIDHIEIEGKEVPSFTELDNYITGLNKGIEKPPKSRGKANYIHKGTLTQEEIKSEIETIEQKLISGELVSNDKYISIIDGDVITTLRNPKWLQ